METIGTYLLRSSVWLAGFGLVYMLFLRNERFFLLNRLYLIGGMILSLVFPLFTWHYTVVIPVVPAVEVLNPMPAMVSVAPERSLSLYDVLWMSYVSGFLLLILRTLTQLFTVGKVVAQSEIRSFETVKVVHTDRYPASFSFFNFVFVNPSIAENEMREIVHHEREHIGQRHWIDLMLFELVCLVQWFNPMVWLYGRMIRQNHEYLADERALQRSQNPAVYRAALLNQMFGGPVIPLTNSFNYSLNKKRFYMMKKTISSPIRKLKLLVVLPLIASVFYAFAAPEYEFVEQKKSIKLSPQPQPNSIIIKGKVVDEKGILLIGVNVIEVDKDGRNVVGTVTDRSGIFVIKVTEGDTINVQLFGYQEQKFVAQSGDEKLIVLKKRSKSSAASKTSSVAPPPPPKLAEYAVGKVVDEAGNQLDMAGVRIYDKNGNYDGGTVTDRNGRFALPIQEGTKLNVAMPGYLTQTVITETGKEMLIVLKKAGSTGDQKSSAEPKFAILKGKVVDEAGNTLPFAYIMEVDKNGRNLSGTTTDNSGVFVLKAREGSMLNVVLSGYQAQKVVPETDKEMLLVLKKASVSSDNSNSSVQNSSPNLVIRGAGSLDKAKPLIVIDGAIAENQDVNAINPDKIQSVEVLKGESATALYGEKGKNGVVKITLKKATSTGSDEVYFMVDEMPQFPGGDAALLQFIARSVKYPVEAQEKGIQGKVMITFVVSKTGDVKDARVARGADPLLDKEALRVVNALPKWKPGKKDGVLANVAYTVPVNFVLASAPKPAAQESDATVLLKSADGSKSIPSILIVIDGKPFGVLGGDFDLGKAGANEFGKLTGVAPEDIESITVLKDAQSIAVYGEKGKNGVMLINTKAAASKKEEKVTEKTVPMKRLIIVPNPASNQATVTAEDMKSAAKLTVRVFDRFGAEIDKTEKTGPTFNLSVSGLASGTYIVVATDGAQSYTGNLVVVR